MAHQLRCLAPCGREQPVLGGRGSSTGRAALSGRVEWIEDVFADSAWASRVAQQAGDYRTSLSVPIPRVGSSASSAWAGSYWPMGARWSITRATASR